MSYLIIILFFLIPIKVTAQIGNSASDSTFSASIKQLSYPIALLIDNKIVSGSCFFIRLAEHIFLVTANHLFTDPISGIERNVSGLSIYTNPDNWNEIGWEISFDDIDVIPVCLDTNCYDIALIPLSPPERFSINLVDIEFLFYPNFFVPVSEIYIPGYPDQIFSLIKTTTVDLNKGGAFFYTELPSSFGASGAPVFGKDGSNNAILAGIYSGRDTRNNRGQITKVGILRNFLLKDKN